MTIYYWVRDLPIPGSGPGGGCAGVGAAQGHARDAAQVRAAARGGLSRGPGSFDELAADPTFRDFVCMYIGEGYKRNAKQCRPLETRTRRRELATQMAALAGVESKFDFALQYHADQDLVRLRAFWGETLPLDPAADPAAAKVEQHRLTGRTWRSPYGVLTVAVYDTLLRARLQAWMDQLHTLWL